MKDTFDIIQYVINIAISVAILLLIIGFGVLIMDNPYQIGVWIGEIVDGIGSVIGI